MSEESIQFRTFEAYPRCVGAVRENFVALIENSPEGGMRLLGAAGYLIGDRIAVLVERGGQKFFQAKDREIAATPEMLETYRRFQDELKNMLAGQK
jgi:hypothetical protein